MWREWLTGIKEMAESAQVTFKLWKAGHAWQRDGEAEA